MVQSDKYLTLAQVVSSFMGSSLITGSVVTPWSLLWIVSLLSAPPPPPVLGLSNIKKKIDLTLSRRHLIT